MNGQTTVQVHSSVYARRFGDELVLLDFARGEYFGLDEVGRVIWDACAGGAKLSDVAALLARDFEVDQETALADVCALVQTLEKDGLVTIEG